MNYKGRKEQVFVCENCGSDFTFKGYSSRNRYCNLQCAADAKSKTNKAKAAELFANGQLTSRPQIYQLLVERDGNRCSVCKISDWNSKPIRLWVDHIDGNATNNQPSNFRLICPNCDSQSETFGARNMGSGRKSRGLPQYG